MGDTLHKVSMEISDNDNSFKLWEKEQVVVAPSQTKLGKRTIFVGDTRDTINALVSLIKTRTQRNEHMYAFLCLVCIGRENNGQYMSVFDYTTYYFQVADSALP